MIVCEMGMHSTVFCSNSILLCASIFCFAHPTSVKCSKNSNYFSSSRHLVTNKGFKEVRTESNCKSLFNRGSDRTRFGEEISCELYNQLIIECCKSGDLDGAMPLLAQMEAKGYRLNLISCCFFIEALGSVGRTLEAEMLFQEMIYSGFKPRLSLYNVLLRALLKKGLLGLALGLLEEMEGSGIRPNQETYEFFLDYYVNAGRLEDTWATINEMKRNGFQLSSFVYSKVVGLYRDNGMWKKAIGVLEEVMDRGVSLDRHFYNSIIDTFGKYGELGEALELFKKMQNEGVRPDIVTWNSLIKWHCKAGDLTKALNLFTDMQEQGLYPDPKIFITIISCLGEQGKWDTIKKTFESMRYRENKYGAVYAVLVDIYGQYGKFQNVEECIQALKSEGLIVTPSIFCVLANAYAQQVCDLFPFSSSIYSHYILDCY